MGAFHRRLLRFVLAVVARPRTTLAVAGVVLAVCVTAAALRLNISADTNKLFDPRVPFFRDYLAFNENFPENEAVYVVVRPRDASASPPVSRWTAAADAIAGKLKGLSAYVRSVDARVPLDVLGSQGLLFDEPERVRQSFEDVKRFIPLVKLWAESPGMLGGLLGGSPMERFLTSLQLAPADAETAAFVELLAKSWNRALAHPNEPLIPGRGLPDLAALDAADPSRLGYYYVPDEAERGQYLLLVRVYPVPNFSSLTAISETVEAIESAVREAATAFPEFTVGVTGRPALDAHEMRTTDRDSSRAEALALTAVFVGLVVFLRSVRLAIVGEVALVVGIGWTFGWATLSVGELNLLSIVFFLALIGIGMDYLVQVLARYRDEAPRRGSAGATWVAVFRHVAAPINTACVGAAGAFLVSTLTDFRGAAELGIIAGGGLLLCLLAGYTVLPALLTVFPMRRAASPALPVRATEPTPPRGRKHLLTPALWCLAVAALSPLAFRTRFDPNLLTLQAPTGEAVQLVRHLQTWSAVVLSPDLNILRAARDALAGSTEVARTESILTAYDNLAWLKAHAGELPTINWSDPRPIDAAALSRLATRARALATRYEAPPTTTRATTAPTTSPAASELRRFADRLSSAKPDDAARLSAWQAAFVSQLKDTLAQFYPTELNIPALPPELRGHFVGKNGDFALHILPRHDLWEQAPLAAFVQDVEARVAAVPGAPKPTGIAVNIHHSTASIERSFYSATAYALGLIFLLVLLDFRRLGPTLLAISVLAFGLPMLVILMGATGVTWNFANFFALPILIGAGHEYGVFLVHRYRESRTDPRGRPWPRWDVADRALLLCAYVTCTSFGFFAILASHRGLRSLGLVMALGTACIYLAAVLVLRPLLKWRLERQARGTSH